VERGRAGGLGPVWRNDKGVKEVAIGLRREGREKRLNKLQKGDLESIFRVGPKNKGKSIVGRGQKEAILSLMSNKQGPVQRLN